MRYLPEWDSLKRHKLPDWLDDAKWGIYFHWGVYSVPAFSNEWYPNNMYSIFSNVIQYHSQKFGEPDKFGYKDFIPMFTAEKFDPDAWAKLFKDSGAQFAGPVAEHHDGFSMWDSKVNEWNAARMGPKRDIVGEMERAIRKQGLKFICTFHHAHNWYFYWHSADLDTGDPRYAGLYGKPHPATGGEGFSGHNLDRPDTEFLEKWFAKLKEVIDAYRPDLIWFDFGLKRIHDKYKRKLAAYYYNAAEEWGKEVEIIYKHHDMAPGMGLLDYERGRSDALTHHKWITDTSMGKKSWSYIVDEEYITPASLIHSFIDRVAKNGYLLLNFGPKASGEIPQEVQRNFHELGKWLWVNNEGVFGSTPWVLAEEGPTRIEKKNGYFNDEIDYKNAYSAEDIRFTTKGNVLYAFTLGWPSSGELRIKSLTAPPKYDGKGDIPAEYYLIEDGDIASIRLLGNDQPLEWHLTGKGLKIRLPAEKPCDHAYCFKIEWT